MGALRYVNTLYGDLSYVNLYHLARSACVAWELYRTLYLIIIAAPLCKYRTTVNNSRSDGGINVFGSSVQIISK